MKFNYQIIIEYLGNNFAGWQIQKNNKSIQSVIEKVLSKTLKTKIKVIGSGRTDAGVNAKKEFGMEEILLMNKQWKKEAGL